MTTGHGTYGTQPTVKETEQKLSWARRIENFAPGQLLRRQTEVAAENYAVLIKVTGSANGYAMVTADLHYGRAYSFRRLLYCLQKNTENDYFTRPLTEAEACRVAEADLICALKHQLATAQADARFASGLADGAAAIQSLIVDFANRMDVLPAEIAVEVVGDDSPISAKLTVQSPGSANHGKLEWRLVPVAAI